MTRRPVLLWLGSVGLIVSILLWVGVGFYAYEFTWNLEGARGSHWIEAESRVVLLSFLDTQAKAGHAIRIHPGRRSSTSRAWRSCTS